MSAPPIPEPARAQVTAYRIRPTAALNRPADPIDVDNWSLRVELTDETKGRWAIRRLGGRCLSHRNEWDPEPIPSERSDRWLHRHRFTEGEAIRRAVEVVDQLRINGRTFAELPAPTHQVGEGA